jgi:hypothetical protein
MISKERDEKYALKKLIISLYFKKHEFVEIENTKLSLSYEDQSILKLFLPKILYRKYFLICKHDQVLMKHRISAKEKPHLKYLVTLINK